MIIERKVRYIWLENKFYEVNIMEMYINLKITQTTSKCIHAFGKIGHIETTSITLVKNNEQMQFNIFLQHNKKVG